MPGTEECKTPRKWFSFFEPLAILLISGLSMGLAGHLDRLQNADHQGFIRDEQKRVVCPHCRQVMDLSKLPWKCRCGFEYQLPGRRR